MAIPGPREFLRIGATALVVAAAAPRAFAQGKIKPTSQDVLLVVDVQNCPLPGRSLAVEDGDAIIPIINRLSFAFEHVILTQDWHTPGHVSFASSHQGKKPFETVNLPHGTQVLWPDHCAQGTEGAALDKDLQVAPAGLTIQEGYRKHMDSYSAFYEAGLTGYLRDRGLTPVYACGLATDFCVFWSAMDAGKAGFSACLIEDASHGIDAGRSLARAWQEMQGPGVKRIQPSDIAV
jgi:nicotinamidase/pyrazinamidase